MREESQEVDVIEAQLAVAPEATPKATLETTSETAPDPEVETQSDQSMSGAGEASDVQEEVRGRGRARRIPTKVFLENAMEEIRKLDFNKK